MAVFGFRAQRGSESAWCDVVGAQRGCLRQLAAADSSGLPLVLKRSGRVYAAFWLGEGVGVGLAALSQAVCASCLGGAVLCDAGHLRSSNASGISGPGVVAEPVGVAASSRLRGLADAECASEKVCAPRGAERDVHAASGMLTGGRGDLLALLSWGAVGERWLKPRTLRSGS